jgi:hypothetical protein
VSSYQGPRDDPDSDSALVGLTFAACILLLIGFFQLVAGFAAIFQDEFYAVSPNYIFQFDTTAWGWIHLLMGLLLGATGLGLFARQSWAGGVAIALAVLSAVVNFIFIPYYPVWGILVIALDVWVIWSLTRPGAMRT